MKIGESQDFYDNPEIWNPEMWQQREDDIERAKLAAEWLPSEVSQVLDVGCGNGVYTNLAESGRFKVGLDTSRVALEHVTAPRLQADASHLPFDDGSFDAGLSMEMLEHLPESIYQVVLSELERIARKYILITVPYNEQIKYNLVVCPRCQHAFHPYHHLRQYLLQDLKTLFSPHYRLDRLTGLVPVKREAFPFLWNVIRVYQHRQGRNFPAMAVCPQCGYTSASRSDPNKPASRVHTVNSNLKKLWPKRRTYQWWMALYEKTLENE
jgi:SAM-dependent methyltransferase